MSILYGRRLLSTLLLLAAALLVQAQPETPPEFAGTDETSETAGAEVEAKVRPPEEILGDRVAPTAAGGRGGAAPQTQALPLEVRKLAEMRQAQLGKAEFRAAWVTRFDWVGRGGSDPDAMKKRIAEYMKQARSLGLNAIIFQVRGDATVLYPSKYEPWAKMIGGTDPGFDPLQLAIREAHRHGLEFHAYINPVPCSEEKTDTPASPDHIWYKHCTPRANPNWLVFKGGKPAAFNEYRWLNPNLPEVQTYIRTVVLDLVKRYDIDGVHYDRIRFPSNDVSDDPWSKARFAGGTNPLNRSFNEWQTDNITRMLTDIYASIMEVKPHVKVSASVWGIYDKSVLPPGRDKNTGYAWTSSGLQNYMQDSVGWANRGCVDALVPMIYWNMGDAKPDYDELLLSFTGAVRSGRHVYGGQRVFAPGEMLRQVVATNLIGAQGTVPFTLNRISKPETAAFYRKYINPSPAPLPDMPWKKNPETGHVLVTVKGPGGKPVKNAIVKIGGRESDPAISSADGFCALLNLPPSIGTLRAEKGGVASAIQQARIEKGKTVRVELTMPSDK